MIRSPRTPKLRDPILALKARAGASKGRKTLVYAGAGLALASAGAVIAAAGFTGSTASAAATGSVVRVLPAITVTHAATAQGRMLAAITHPGPRPDHSKAKPARSGRANGTRTRHAGTRRPAAGRHAAQHAVTWPAVSRIVAKRTSPAAGHGALPAQDKLTPAGTSGPQTWMPMTPDRYDNARTIIRQALAKRMGVRAAVIAVATSMQESGLLNIDYGTSDSVGLFQQRPSMGWGSVSQIMHPAYAADAFLNALHGYEVSNPGWARQPLWQSAQGVQNSGFPYAYAKWEAQAAHLVATITPHLV